MVRRVFFSFHYKRDAWRTQEVRNIGAIHGSKPVSPNEWETVRKKGIAATKQWINKQLKRKTCLIVLIGTETANRKWVRYEIEKAWEEKKGVLGIYIHNLKDRYQEQCEQGENPLESLPLTRKDLRMVVHNPPQKTSKKAYAHIEQNIADWVETAIAIREEYP